MESSKRSPESSKSTHRTHLPQGWPMGPGALLKFRPESETAFWDTFNRFRQLRTRCKDNAVKTKLPPGNFFNVSPSVSSPFQEECADLCHHLPPLQPPECRGLQKPTLSSKLEKFLERLSTEVYEMYGCATSRSHTLLEGGLVFCTTVTPACSEPPSTGRCWVRQDFGRPYQKTCQHAC